MSPAQDTIPRQLQRGIPNAVPLERRAGTVEVVPVELDNEPPLVPDDVHLDACGEGVDCGRRQAGAPAQVEKSTLEFRACRRGFAIVRKHRAQQSAPASALTAGIETLEGTNVQLADPLGLLECPLELTWEYDSREVQKRAGNRGDRYALANSAIILVQISHAMHEDARPAPAA